jgi:ppGpp synthetase/RelA/SpoT-type nucleotidyltranferase
MEIEKEGMLLEATALHENAKKCLNMDRLIGVFEEVSELPEAYVFKYRFKRPKDIVSKVLRKREQGKADLTFLANHHSILPPPTSLADERLATLSEAVREKFVGAIKNASYEIRHLDDSLGCRFVTLYQSGIPRTVELLLSKIEEFNNQRLKSVFPVKMKEFVIYSNRLPDDPLSITDEIYSIVQRSKQMLALDRSTNIRPPESKKSAYSSVHFVFERQLPADGSDKYWIGVPLATVSFEVQIRDIFEEGWGEIQHHLLYSDKDKIAPASAASNSWSPHLNALKTFVDGCSQHASIIWKTKTGGEVVEQGNPEDRSFTERDLDYVSILHAAKGAEKEELDKLTVAYTHLIAVERDKSAIARILKYTSVVENLQAILDGARDSVLNSPVAEFQKRTVWYFLRMELANSCYAIAATVINLTEHETSGSQNSIPKSGDLAERAIENLEQVRVRYPTDAAAAFRLARCKMLVATSSSDFRQVRDLTEFVVTSSGNDDVVPGKHWIVSAAKLTKGAAFRRESLITGDNASAARSLYDEAINATFASVQSAREYGQNQPGSIAAAYEHRALSNCLYFLAEYGENYPDARPQCTQKLLGFCKDYSDLGQVVYPEAFRSADNLAKAMTFLGRRDDARRIASDVYSTLRSECESRAGAPLVKDDHLLKHLRPRERPSFLAAAAILANAE